jgi:TRAP-type C4-dicarboxylate transport system substrate-binding protein
MGSQTIIFFLLLAPLLLLSAPSLAETGRSPSHLKNLVDEGVVPMRITAIHGADFGYIRALKKWAPSLEEASEGRIKVELLLGGAMGSEAEALKKQIRRKIEGGLTSATTLAYSLESFRLLTLPLLFTAPSHIQSFIDSPLDQAIRETAAKKRLKVLGYGSYGFYGLLVFEENEATTEEPPAEPLPPVAEGFEQETPLPPSLTGLSVRAPVDRWMWHVHKALSVKQVTVPVADLPEAIESGWVEGIVSTPETLINTSYPYDASHYFDIRQQHGWMVFTVNKNWFEKLPADLQPLVEESVVILSQQMQEAAFYQDITIRDEWAAEEDLIVVPSIDAELEAAFRPLVFRTARRLERKLGIPSAIQDLWEQNRTQESRTWQLPEEEVGQDSGRKAGMEREERRGIKQVPGVEMQELMMHNMIEERENPSR